MKVAIIGAGLAGLTCAYELREHEVTVFEAEDRLGGKLHTVAFNDGPTDMGAEAFLAFRQDTKDFFTQELGLNLVAPSGLPSQVFAGGKLQALPRATVMGIPGRGETVAGLVSPETVARIDAELAGEPLPWTPGQDASVGELVAERFGSDLVERVVNPLLGGVYSSLAKDLGVRATMGQLAAVLDQCPTTLAGAVQKILAGRKAPAPGEKPPATFASFAGGYAEVYETLAEKSGANIYIDAFVSGVKQKGDKWQVLGVGLPEETLFDQVILATPAPTSAAIVHQVLPETAVKMRQIKLASSAVVGMKFADATDLPEISGVLVATDEPGLQAKAFTFSSRKWPHLGARGGALIRASFGRLGDDALVRQDDEQLVEYALDDLQKVSGFPGRERDLREIYVKRWYGGIPALGAGHGELVAQIQAEVAAVPGLHVIGAWVSGVGVPNVVAHARQLAQDVASGKVK